MPVPAVPHERIGLRREVADPPELGEPRVLQGGRVVECAAEEGTAGEDGRCGNEGGGGGRLPRDRTDPAAGGHVAAPRPGIAAPGAEDHADPDVVVPVDGVAAVRGVDGVGGAASVDVPPGPLDRGGAAVAPELTGLTVGAEAEQHAPSMPRPCGTAPPVD